MKKVMLVAAGLLLSVGVLACPPGGCPGPSDGPPDCPDCQG